MIVPCAYISGIIILAWISISSLGNLFAAAIMYSFFSGGLMALPPAVLVTLSPSLNQIGIRVGMALTIGSFGVLIGSPIAGAILKAQSDNARIGEQGSLNFKGTLAFTGAMLIVCGAFMTVTRVNKKGIKWEKV